MNPRDNDGRVLNATYSIEADGEDLALILESAGGRIAGSEHARNADYREALTLLLGRLRDHDAVLVAALVDSSSTQHLREQERMLIDQPIRLADEPDMEALRHRLTSPQGVVGQRPGAPKAGNNSKRIRLRLEVPGYGTSDAHRLATALARRMIRTARNAPPPDQDDARSSEAAEVAGDPEVFIDSHGAGYAADLHHRTQVEHAAVRAVTDWFESDQWSVEDVSRQRCGWDLTCRSADGRSERHVEVKGVSGGQPKILLTRNEFNVARRDPCWDLFVVTRALAENRRVRRFPAADAVKYAEPLIYEVALPDEQQKPDEGRR